MRILVTGAGGQVGHDVVDVCERAGDEVIPADHTALEVIDRDAVLQAITATRPQAIIHAAAWTAVDACEGDPERAFATNAFGTRHVAEAARRVGAHLLYLSTDYVFDGTLDRAYHEWDEPNPVSVYGRSKLAGEHEVTVGPDTTIVRTSWVCGFHGPNMAKTVLRLAAEPGPLRFVDDQRGSPTLTADLAPLLRRLVVERRPGLFHATNQGETTWHGFARSVMEAAGHDPDRVQPISTAELDPPRPAPRPANSVLENAALRLSGLPLLPPWRESLGRLVSELGAGHASTQTGPIVGPPAENVQKSRRA